MSVYKRSDMLYSYSWTTTGSDSPKLRGKPDSALFNRGEGYEVLYMINQFLESKSLISVSSGNKAETLIHEKLPGKIFSQVALMEWLKDNW